MKIKNSNYVPCNEKELEDLFLNNDILYIINTYSKKEIIDMYKIIYSVKPLSSFDKKQIVSTISNYFHEMIRSKALSIF